MKELPPVRIRVGKEKRFMQMGIVFPDSKSAMLIPDMFNLFKQFHGVSFPHSGVAMVRGGAAAAPPATVEAPAPC